MDPPSMGIYHNWTVYIISLNTGIEFFWFLSNHEVIWGRHLYLASQRPNGHAYYRISHAIYRRLSRTNVIGNRWTRFVIFQIDFPLINYLKNTFGSGYWYFPWKKKTVYNAIGLRAVVAAAWTIVCMCMWLVAKIKWFHIHGCDTVHL